jgi:O-antigen ligase
MRNIKPAYRVLIFLIICAALVIVPPLIPQATINRLSTFGDSVAGNDLGGRTMLWKESFAIFLVHPFLGIGSNALSAPGQLGAFAHNTFLSIMAELGLVGILLFLTILAIVVYQAIRQPGPYALLWITVFVIWLIGAFTLTWEYTKATWFFLNLIVISAGIYNRREKMVEDPVPSGHSWAEPKVPAA